MNYDDYSPTGPKTNRRVSPSDLKRTKKALKKAIRKERTRRDNLLKLHKVNEILQSELNGLRSDRNFPIGSY